MVWPLMVAGTAAATYLIVTNNDLIIQRSGFGFAPLLMLSLVSIVSGILCTMSMLTEDWHPRMRTNVGPLVPDELWPPAHMRCPCWDAWPRHTSTDKVTMPPGCWLLCCCVLTP